MRILHTSDWHLGKRLEGRERLPEQRKALEEIRAVAEREKVDLILVAGDVFDAYVPPADAEDAFFEGVGKMADVCPVVVVGGNHDDARRLAASRTLAEKREIYIAGNNTTLFTPPAAPAFACRLLRSGEGYLVFGKGDERVWLGILPYPNEARFRVAERADETDAEKIRGWMEACFAENVERLPQVLVAHLFAENAVTGGGEREITLGGARAVPKDFFPECAYIALGHIHKYQKLSESRRIWYSGAILPYAFDETDEKAVQVFDLTADGKAERIRKIALTSGKRLVRLEANSTGAAEVILGKYADCFVELTLRLEHALAPAEYRAFTAAHPEIAKLVLSFPGAEGARPTERRQELSDEELFRGFYRAQYGSDPPDDLLKLYLRLMQGGADDEEGEENAAR